MHTLEITIAFGFILGISFLAAQEHKKLREIEKRLHEFESNIEGRVNNIANNHREIFKEITNIRSQMAEEVHRLDESDIEIKEAHGKQPPIYLKAQQ